MENLSMSSTRVPGSPIRVAIIEDQRDIRECLTFLINGTEGFSCTGGYRSMEEALDRIGSALPDIVLADIGLPGMNGIEGVKILKERYPDLLILMSTVYDDDETRVRRNLRRRLWISTQENPAREAFGKHTRGRRGRRSDDARSSAPRNNPFSRGAASRTRKL